jgi:hypothetical protein
MIARIGIGIAFVVVANSPLPAQSGIRADADSAAMAEIEALEHHLIDLLEQRDMVAYASYLAEDYVRVNAAGRVDSVESVLDQFRSGAGSGGKSIPSDLDIRIYGDTAVLSFVLTIETNGIADRRSRLVKVFVRRNGGWIMVHNQGTPLE